MMTSNDIGPQDVFGSFIISWDCGCLCDQTQIFHRVPSAPQSARLPGTKYPQPACPNFRTLWTTALLKTFCHLEGVCCLQQCLRPWTSPPSLLLTYSSFLLPGAAPDTPLHPALVLGFTFRRIHLTCKGLHKNILGVGDAAPAWNPGGLWRLSVALFLFSLLHLSLPFLQAAKTAGFVQTPGH